jgi:hypothetical protein
MKTPQMTLPAVTTFVTLGFLLLVINNGQALTNGSSDVEKFSQKYSQSNPTPTPSRTATPIPTVTPIATASPISTPIPTASPPTSTPAPTASASSGFPGLGTAGKYAVLSLTGTFQNQSLVTINGDVGIGPYSLATTQATINGSLFYDPSTRYAGTGSVTGGTYVQSMMQPALDAWTASNLYKNYATQSNVFSSISAATTIVGQSGFNVFSLSGGITLNNANLTLSGSSSAYFVFNIYGGLALSGNASINLTGGLTASNVLFNFIGPGSALTTQIGDTVRGTILSVGRSISFDGVFIGEIIGGGSGSYFTLLSGTTVGGQPTAAAPAPAVSDRGSTIWLSLIALCAVAVVERSLLTKSVPRRV